MQPVRRWISRCDKPRTKNSRRTSAHCCTLTTSVLPSSLSVAPWPGSIADGLHFISSSAVEAAVPGQKSVQVIVPSPRPGVGGACAAGAASSATATATNRLPVRRARADLALLGC